MKNIYTIRKINSSDKPMIQKLLIDHWAEPLVITKGHRHFADELPGFVAECEGKLLGLITLSLHNQECEIVTLDSLKESHGIGSALLKASEKYASDRNSKRIWLITTNDNTHAIRFYQKKGYDLVAVHRNAIENSRKLKPSILRTGNDGIPIQHEVELEKLL